MLQNIIFLILSYFIGAIPTAYLVGKWVKGIDIREHGSKNVGATNVFRCVGKGWGIFALLFDICKGVLAVTLPPLFSPDLSLLFVLLCGIVAVFGHNWTVFLKFKGGKGVATTLGILLGLFPQSILITLAIALTVIFTTGYVSLGSLVGAALFPFFFFICHRDIPQFPIFMAINILLMLLIFMKHRKNIQRLLEGSENRISFGKKG